MITFLIGSWLGCCGGFLVAGLLRKASAPSAPEPILTTPNVRAWPTGERSVASGASVS